MTGNLTLALLTGLLYTTGTYLLLQRTLVRVVLGLGLLAHGANLLLLQSGGPPGAAPFATAAGGGVVNEGTADPLPQAMVLTAIVITFGVSTFLLALAYRSWLLTGDDEVQDDVEDARVARSAPDDPARTRASDELSRTPSPEGDGR